MFEIKITVDAPELSTAINNLAQALSANAQISIVQPETITASDSTLVEAPDITNALTEAAKATQQNETLAQNIKTITLDDLSRAGAELIDQGKMPQLLELLNKNGVQAITQLKAEQYAAVVNELKALGAKL